MAADLRATIAKLTTFRCTWTAEEVAALSEMPVMAARKYLTALVHKRVLINSGPHYAPGPQAREWRANPPKAKGPSTYGNSKKYRELRAKWDELRQRDWQAAKSNVQNAAPTLTSQEPITPNIGQHDQAGDNSMGSMTNAGGSLTYDEVATELGVHVETVRREVKRGRLAAHNVGLRGVRITREALDKYRTNNAIVVGSKV